MKVIYSWRLRKLPRPKSDLLEKFIRQAVCYANLEMPPNTNIAVFFLGTAKMKELNRKFLNHNYLTDVICFNYLGDSFENEEFEDDTVVEIFVSPDIAFTRVFNNFVATDYHTELALYIVHGILHAAGFNDKTSEQQAIMCEKQERVIAKLAKEINFKELFPLN